MNKVKMGVIGLGTLGYEHAKNIATEVPGAELTAVSDVNEGRMKEVAERLGVKKTCQRPEELCADPELDAVIIVSPTAMHVDHIRMAMENGKHVFTEKPLGDTVEKCLQAEKIVEAHPDQFCMVGFMRHFDKSYAMAKKKIEEGAIGRVVLVRSYTQDPRSILDRTLKFAPISGGQFLDMFVHDLDLVRWFAGADVKRVWGIGGVFEFPLYRELNDGDNCAATVVCENGTMGFMFTNRTHPAGSNVETEIVGTEGTLRVANVGARNLLEVVDSAGPHYEYYPDFVRRWHEAYVNEIREFTSCILEGRRPESDVYEGTAASRAAYRCKESFETGKQLDIV